MSISEYITAFADWKFFSIITYIVGVYMGYKVRQDEDGKD